MMSHIDPEQNAYEPENALLWVSVESYSIGISIHTVWFTMYYFCVNDRVSLTLCRGSVEKIVRKCTIDTLIIDTS